MYLHPVGSPVKMGLQTETKVKPFLKIRNRITFVLEFARNLNYATAIGPLGSMDRDKRPLSPEDWNVLTEQLVRLSAKVETAKRKISSGKHQSHKRG